MTTHQVIIIGGGLVGGLTALLLKKGGVSALILDAGPRPDSAKALAQMNPRVLALNAASLRLMQYTDVWSRVSRHQPYSGMQVINRDGRGELMFGEASIAAPMPRDWLGSMVEPSLLNAAIAETLSEQTIDIRYQVSVQRIEQTPQGWQVTLADGQRLFTPLLIGADGAQSMVRQQAHIGLDELDYDQTALTCAIRTQQTHQHVARQIFLPTGPLALLPMASPDATQQGHWQSIVWTLPSDHAAELAQLSDEAFAQQLTQASQHWLGEVMEVQSRAQFPLRARQAQHYVCDGLALVGDAAHVIHPLAGQGVNLGCLDAAQLADCLLTDLARGVWAHRHTLQRYETRRRTHNSLMMHAMSGLGWVNCSQLRPIQQLRGESIHWLSRQSQLVEFFNHQASGMQQLKGTRYA